MQYPYICKKCEKEHVINKSMHQAGMTEHCEGCGNILDRVWGRFQIMGAAVQHAEFNIGLGAVTKNKKHREELARRRGVVEVGSETAEAMKREGSDASAARKQKEWDAL